MKTFFHRALLALTFVAALSACRGTRAGNIISDPVLAEDTFTLNTNFTTIEHTGAGNFSSFDQTRSLDQVLSSSMPELRELDAIHDWIGAPVSQRWVTSSTNLIVKQVSGNNGAVGRSDTDHITGDVAVIPVFRQGNGTGYPDANWIMSAQVKPGINEFVGLGWTEDAATPYGMKQGYGEVWAMLQTIQGKNGTEENQSDDYLFGRLCLWVNDVDPTTHVQTQTMVARYENVTNTADLSIGAAKGNFAYDPSGFNELIITYEDDTNSATIAVNGMTVIAANLDAYDFDADVDGIQLPDFFGAGFELRGSAMLDNFAATPEPSSMMMMCFGMVFFGWHNRRQRRRARKLGGMALSITG